MNLAPDRDTPLALSQVRTKLAQLATVVCADLDRHYLSDGIHLVAAGNTHDPALLKPSSISSMRKLES
jgi:hypothetical protein